MKKSFLTLMLCSVFVLAGCASSLNRLPNKFDNVEYRDLVELNVLSKWSDTCKSSELKRMDYLGKILSTYSSNRLNADIAEIYSEISRLTSELRERENPSDAYCKLKRDNISETTDRALEVFGERLS